MEMRPPCVHESISQVQASQLEPQDTYDVVVLAADGLLGAAGSELAADDSDRVALQADLTGHVLDADAEGTEQGQSRRGVGLGA